MIQIAANKEKTEGLLAGAMNTISDRLPGLKLYSHIYTDNHELDMRLQNRILSTYQNFIGLSIEASKYYKIAAPRKYLTEKLVIHRR